MNETQKDGRSTYGSPAPLSREQMQQQMQAAFQDGSNRPRKKKQPEQRRISDMPNGKPVKKGKRGNQPEPMPRSVGQAKAEKLRQIKASVASASQGIYNEETPSATAAEAHRYVHRRSSAPPPPFRHGTETAVRKNRNIMAVRMWHLPEKAERLLVL